MLIRIDQAARKFRFVTQANHGDGQRYYCASPPLRAILVCRNGLDLHDLIGRIVDANIGNERGMLGFVQEANIGKQHTKITIYRALVQSTPSSRDWARLGSDSSAPARALSDVLHRAPKGGR